MIIPRRKVVLSFEPILDKKGVCLNPGVLSKTSQAEKDSLDINRIMKNHKENGGIIGDPFRKSLNEQVENGTLDLTNFGDYREVKTRAVKAEQTFMLLPPDIRNQFDNDPQKLYEFLLDSKNDKKAVELGLKHENVLKTALADDGKTRITPEQRAELDKIKAEKLAAAAKAAAAPASGGETV